MTTYSPYPTSGFGDSGATRIRDISGQNTGHSSGTFVATYSGGGAATSYAISTSVAGNTISAASFTNLLNYVNGERARRYVGATSITFSGLVDPTTVNSIVSALNVGNNPATTGVSGSPASNNGYIDGANALQNWPTVAGYAASGPAASTSLIAAANLTAIVNSINGAAAYCTCNCNYCTCNCNYCTCNCNYACTCNCNYSDERLKENIEFVRTEHGINLYSWNYLWDKTKSYVGVLAQELVGTKHAAALSTDKNGYFMVDYVKLPVNMIEG